MPEGSEESATPDRIGRYRVERLLGEGGFGRVYLAHDDELQRPLAIKVPHRSRVQRPADAEAYMAEARVLAKLDHAGIVPVHDVGRTDDGLCYVVSKFISGSNLRERIKGARPPHLESAQIVSTVADALHFAHKNGVVHRDIKPANILLDTQGKPYVADFGLALNEEDLGAGPGYLGTPTYMSPEQARGEGHLVDGRTDIFSLGVVFYELLTGRRPFHGDTPAQLMDRIATLEARPPRQVDDTIPQELERICLKALSKRASDRYTTAKDMAGDLRYFLEPKPAVAGHAAAAATPAAVSPPEKTRPAARVIPKGLRSFDAKDADFFLDLLAGPRDRDGLPETIRFWKIRIEETDAEQTFRVGLVYGPSGCGKSSLVKAGLIPRLAGHVIAVYVEATGEETEPRLRAGLRKACPGLPREATLLETLTALRRAQAVPDGKKVCIVLDQFEQWLHTKGKDAAQSELVAALRQCDGSHLQCVLTVRDDFWLGSSRLFQLLEIRLVEDHNVRLVDLFDLDHARKVLRLFGQSYGRLPHRLDDCTQEQNEFLQQAVQGLAQEDKVISIRLSLFADMLKGRP